MPWLCEGNTLEKCLLPRSASKVGGGFWMVISSTFMGGYRAKGACPWAISRMVMPKDQMSARQLYLPNRTCQGSSCKGLVAGARACIVTYACI